MPLLVITIKRLPSGAWCARKAIPSDVREDHARLYKQRWEAKLTLPAALSAHEARVGVRRLFWHSDCSRIGTGCGGHREFTPFVTECPNFQKSINARLKCAAA
jgi:hypothetical protein